MNRRSFFSSLCGLVACIGYYRGNEIGRWAEKERMDGGLIEGVDYVLCEDLAYEEYQKVFLALKQTPPVPEHIFLSLKKQVVSGNNA